MEHDITNLKIEVAVINEKLDSQSKKMDEVLSTLKEHVEDENVWKEGIMQLKADRKDVDEIKKNLSTVVWIVLGSVITAIVSLVLIK